MIGDTLTERRQRLLQKRGMFVSTAPEIAEALSKTSLFSSKSTFAAAIINSMLTMTLS